MVPREKVGNGTDTDSDQQTVPVNIYKETLPNGVVHTIQEISDDGPLDNTAEYVVPAGPLLHDGRQPRPFGRQPGARPMSATCRPETSKARPSPLLLDQGRYPAVADLEVAGQCPLGIDRSCSNPSIR